MAAKRSPVAYAKWSGDAPAVTCGVHPVLFADTREKMDSTPCSIRDIHGSIDALNAHAPHVLYALHALHALHTLHALRAMHGQTECPSV